VGGRKKTSHQVTFRLKALLLLLDERRRRKKKNRALD
jgi:hypothetical protein